ncbi:MAG: hypothetical protein ABFE02_01680 [Sulfuricella sp.]
MASWDVSVVGMLVLRLSWMIRAGQVVKLGVVQFSVLGPAEKP